MADAGLPTQRYDAAENIVFVSHPTPVSLETPAQLEAYFDEIVRFWRANCRGRKAWYLVDWNGFATNLRENDAYARHVERVVEQCAEAIVRYGGDALRKTAGRLVAVKLHVPSHVYESHEEAIAVLRGLRDGTVQRATSRPGTSG